MIDILKKIFGLEPEENYAELVQSGALILDVRTKNEFSEGHIKGAINIPVNELENNLSKLKDKTRGIITYCESGARSSFAKKILLSNGYTNVYNGGGWRSLTKKMGRG